VQFPGGELTSIARVWPHTEWSACRRCPKGDCYVDEHGLCLIRIVGFVSDEDAPTIGLNDILDG
jgi:hypothetical protein